MLWGQYTEGTWHFGLKVGLGNTITIAVVGQYHEAIWGDAEL